MFRFIVAALVSAACLSTPVDAQERKRLGYGRLITNDFFGDGEDRWRTGGFQSSRVWGPTWAGQAPEGFGQLLELRLGAEILAPDDIRTPAPGDRPYAGALSIGLHTHFQRGRTEFSVGGDLVFLGPQTRLDEFQDAFHDTFNIVRPSDAVRSAQIGNAINPTVVVEMGQTYALSDSTVVRPFLEGRAGNETLVRAGVDLTFGALGQGELLIRDSVTGHRYRAIEGDWSGYSFVLGADIAAVSDSEFLPADRGVIAEDSRERVRAGIMWQSEAGISGFYGLTYLGEEFEGQSEGQIVGSVRFKVAF
ncbi:lipid A-modifier LpxR family protein [uncultured Tateyamaria sp.]|uniref:lipid A-modifier LpxR family protein n=1 Tax=uncultured Tateyamaria sp. TaxID=455651 RepID=UPI00260A5B26|nr:lipid A-modifier LpxR family protein [uncultured Tateyamaria sp.]